MGTRFGIAIGAVALTIHGWLALDAMRVAHDAEEAANTSSPSDTIVDALAGSIATQETRLDDAVRALTDRRAPGSTPVRAVASSRDDSQAIVQRWLTLAVKIAELEVESARVGFESFTRFGNRQLASFTPSRPLPESPFELARAAHLACLTTLGYRHPQKPDCARAIAILQRELLGNVDRLHMRLRALKELHRLAPQQRIRDSVLVLTENNETACGGTRVPEAAIAGILEIGRQRPKLRRDVLEQLRFARGNTEVLAYAIELLSDPQPFSRWTASVTLMEWPDSAERDRALDTAAERETDPKLRELLHEGRRR